MADLPKGQGVFMPPFKSWLASNIPAVYDNTMTYYEELCALIKYLETQVVPALNHNAAAVTTISKALEQLKQYVDDYFKNLDVQDEINNKLDEMAESGELEALIRAAADKLKIFFIKKTAKNGDSSLLIARDKSLLIDTHISSEYSVVKGMLDANGVTELDYVIITHYHLDHYGNFEALYNDGYITTNTKLFMPAETTTYSGLNSAIVSMKEFCEDHNLDYNVPVEFSTFSIDDDYTLQFFNTDATVIDNYTDHDENNTSMITLINYKKTKLLYTGDARRAVLDRMVDENFATEKVNFYKVEHHGINARCSTTLLAYLSPDIAVHTGGTDRFKAGEFARCETINLLTDGGCKVIPTFTQSDYVNLESDGDSVYVVEGKCGTYSYGEIQEDIYVDAATANTKQDGSQTYPFKSLGQALGKVHHGRYTTSYIHLANGNYCYELEDYGYPLNGEYNRANIRSNRGTIFINSVSGNKEDVIINGFNIWTSTLYLSNVTVDCANHSDTIYCRFADVYLNNVEIKASDGVGTNHSGVYLNNSRLFADGCVFDDVAVCVSSQNGSEAHLKGCTYGSNITRAKDIGQASTIIEEGSIYDDATIKAGDTRVYSKIADPVLVYNNQTPEYVLGSFAVDYNPSDFNAVIIEYIDVNGCPGSTGILTDLGNHWTALRTDQATTNATHTEYISTIQWKTKTVTYQRNSKISFANGSATVANERNISITRIIGLRFNYTDRTSE